MRDAHAEQFVKPMGENGTPRAVCRNVRLVLGASASARASSGWIGTGTTRAGFAAGVEQCGRLYVLPPHDDDIAPPLPRIEQQGECEASA